MITNLVAACLAACIYAGPWPANVRTSIHGIIDSKLTTISATMDISFDVPQGTREAVFLLDLNNGAYPDPDLDVFGRDFNPYDFVSTRTVISHVLNFASGQALKPIYSRNPLLVFGAKDNTMLTVPVNTDEHGRVHLRFRFVSTLPRDRWTDEGMYTLSGFIPQLVMYNPEEKHWNAGLLCASTYNGTLQVPGGMTMACAGQAPCSTLRNKSVKIDTPVTRSLVIALVKDGKMESRSSDGLECRVIYRHARRADALRIISIALDAMSFLESEFGPMPFKGRVSIIEDPSDFAGSWTWGGLIFLPSWWMQLPDFAIRRGLEYVLAHELSHQWWSQLLMENSDRPSWISEGMANLSGLRYLRYLHGNDSILPDNAITRLFLPGISLYSQQRYRFREAAADGLDLSLSEPFRERKEWSALDVIHYSLGTFTMESLMYRADPGLMLKGMKNLFARNAWGSVDMNDLVASGDIRGRDAKEFLDVTTSRSEPNWALNSPGPNRLVVTASGAPRFSTGVSVALDDGSFLNLPVDGSSTRYEFSFEHRIRSATVDPGDHIAETDERDNNIPRKTLLRASLLDLERYGNYAACADADLVRIGPSITIDDSTMRGGLFLRWHRMHEHTVLIKIHPGVDGPLPLAFSAVKYRPFGPFTNAWAYCDFTSGTISAGLYRQNMIIRNRQLSYGGGRGIFVSRRKFPGSAPAGDMSFTANSILHPSNRQVLGIGSSLRFLTFPYFLDAVRFEGHVSIMTQVTHRLRLDTLLSWGLGPGHMPDGISYDPKSWIAGLAPDTPFAQQHITGSMGLAFPLYPDHEKRLWIFSVKSTWATAWTMLFHDPGGATWPATGLDITLMCSIWDAPWVPVTLSMAVNQDGNMHFTLNIQIPFL